MGCPPRRELCRHQLTCAIYRYYILRCGRRRQRWSSVSVRRRRACTAVRSDKLLVHEVWGGRGNAVVRAGVDIRRRDTGGDAERACDQREFSVTADAREVKAERVARERRTSFHTAVGEMQHTCKSSHVKPHCNEWRIFPALAKQKTDMGGTYLPKSLQSRFT